MARKVKCCVTGKWGTSDTFLKIDGKYYENQEVYDWTIRMSNCWRLMIDKITIDYLGYQKGEPYPTILNKRLKSLDFYDNEVIYRTVLFCDESISNAMKTKDFESTYMKIQYILAVLRNNIAKVWKIVREERKAAKEQGKKLDDIVYIESLETVKNPKQINKDISMFVED